MRGRLVDGAGRRRAARGVRQRPEVVTVPLVFVLFLLCWEGGIRLFKISVIMLPGPLAIVEALWNGLSSGILLYHLWVTVKEIFGGFALGGVLGLLIGAVVSQFRLVEKTFFAYLVALQTIPKLAIAPLIVVWFGFGLESKIVIGALVCFFPMVVNVIEGLQSTDPKQVDLLRAMGATRWQVFRMIKVPNALPFVFVGINIGIVMAVLGAIVGEFVGAQAGLGFLILQYNFQLEMAKVFAVVVLLALTGIVLHASVKMAHRRMVFWVKLEQVIGA